jgi:hypothetical protein
MMMMLLLLLLLLVLVPALVLVVRSGPPPSPRLWGGVGYGTDTIYKSVVVVGISIDRGAPNFEIDHILTHPPP